MYEAILSILSTIRANVVVPIRDALNTNGLLQPIINFINGLLDNLFRINNDANALKVSISSELISAVIGLIVLVLIIEITYAIFKIVFTAFETIQNNINSFDNKQKWKKRGGHKKK